MTITGKKYEGTFVSGIICGEGTFYNTDGTKFVGTFVDFNNAIGTYHDKDGISYEAIIKDGYLSWQQTEKNESENTQQPEAQSTENSESQSEEELVGSDLFENVYVPYAQREGRVFAFEAVKTFAENFGYDYKLSEPSEDEESLTYIKVMDGDDYVYFAFSPVEQDILVQSLDLISYYQAKSNSEVGMSNYSKDRTASYDSFKTHVIGEKEKQVAGVKEQREFLFKN